MVWGAPGTIMDLPGWILGQNIEVETRSTNVRQTSTGTRTTHCQVPLLGHEQQNPRVQYLPNQLIIQQKVAQPAAHSCFTVLKLSRDALLVAGECCLCNGVAKSHCDASSWPGTCPFSMYYMLAHIVELRTSDALLNMVGRQGLGPGRNRAMGQDKNGFNVLRLWGPWSKAPGSPGTIFHFVWTHLPFGFNYFKTFCLDCIVYCIAYCSGGITIAYWPSDR
jgi:hypothetical protein